MATTTLLLNASYEPLTVISWQRAITMLFLGKVEIVEEYDDQSIRSVSVEMRKPAVVRLLRYVKRRFFGVKFSRQNVYARDHYECQYCGKHTSEVEMSLDHVVPRKYGGRSSWENIVTCCVHCNRKKGGRTPSEAGMPLRSKPQKPRSLTQLRTQMQVYIPASWRIYMPGLGNSGNHRR